MNAVYSALYFGMSIYTHVAEFVRKSARTTQRIICSVYQSTMAPSIERLANYFNFQLPACLQTIKMRQQDRKHKLTQIEEFPWIAVMYDSEKDKWFESEHTAVIDIMCAYDEYNHNVVALKFVLYRVFYKQMTIYRRFADIEKAYQWYSQFDDKEQAKKDVVENYCEEHPFIQLTPRSTDYDWKHRVKPFSVKGNMILDKDFIHWCLQDTGDTVDDHYPFNYIDSSVSMGTIDSSQHFVVK